MDVESTPDPHQGSDYVSSDIVDLTTTPDSPIPPPVTVGMDVESTPDPHQGMMPSDIVDLTMTPDSPIPPSVPVGMDVESTPDPHQGSDYMPSDIAAMATPPDTEMQDVQEPVLGDDAEAGSRAPAYEDEDTETQTPGPTRAPSRMYIDSPPRPSYSEFKWDPNWSTESKDTPFQSTYIQVRYGRNAPPRSPSHKDQMRDLKSNSSNSARDRNVRKNEICKRKDATYGHRTVKEDLAFVSEYPTHMWLQGGGSCSPWQTFVIEAQDAKLDDDKDRAIVPQGFSIQDQLTYARARCILFAATALWDSHEPGLRFCLLHELSKSSGHTFNYQECRDRNACCLNFDFTWRGYKGREECRHWLFHSRFEVYLDGFEGVPDYRLAMALSSLWEAASSVNEDWKTGQDARRKNSYAVKRWGALDHVYDGGFTKIGAYCKVALTTLTGVLMDVPYKPYWAQDDGTGLAPFSYGRVTLTYADGSQGVGRGFTTMHRGLLIISEISFPRKRLHKRKPTHVGWDCLGSMSQYVRRFEALDQRYERFSAKQWLEGFSMRACRRANKSLEEMQRIDLSDILAEMKRKLNDGQMKTLYQSLTTTGLLMVRGVAGCGKSTTIAAVIRLYHSLYPDRRIFVAAETNVAIDEIVTKLHDEGAVPEDKICRIGVCETEDDRVRRVALRVRMSEASASIQGTDRASRNQREQAVNTCLKQQLHCPVILGTLASFGTAMLNDVNANISIVDEAALASEAGVFCCVREKTETLVMVGDNLQLYAHTHARGLNEFRYPNGPRRHKLQWSVLRTFPHHHNGSFHGITLRTQYRYHQQIGGWIQAFYPYQLEHAASPSADYLKDAELLEHQTVVDTRAVVISTDDPLQRKEQDDYRDTQEEEDRSLVSSFEIRVVVELLARIAGTMEARHTAKKKVLVISPYKNQVRSLTAAVKRLEDLVKQHLDIRVATVDSSQGSEANIVIVSMVRANRSHETGFLRRSPPRWLVALSRVKDYLFVVMRTETFARNDIWDRLRIEMPRNKVKLISDKRNLLDVDDSMEAWQDHYNKAKTAATSSK